MGTGASLAVNVFPTAKEFGPLLQAQIIGPATEVGAKTGVSFSNAFTQQAARAGTGADEAIARAARVSQLAIESAAVKVVAARAREETAAGQVRIAEQRLAEARTKYAAESSQVIAAEERLALAQRNVGLSSDSAKLADEKLSLARKTAADSAKAAATATDAEASALARSKLQYVESSKAATAANEAQAASLARSKALFTETSTTVGGLTSQYGKLGALIGVAIVADMGVKAVKAAGDFQSSQERLVTSAGELQTNLKGVSDGVLEMSGQVGYSAKTISTGMYTVESAGYHGAEGLKVMRAAAEGAKTENADLTVVTDAVTSAMQDYHLGADQAALVTSKMVVAVGDGKTTFEQLTGAMSAVLPKASAAHIGLDEILGDLSAMTLHGMSAQQSSQNLADAISHLSNPTQAMTKEMAALGLSSADLSKNLGHTGVSGAMAEIEQAILQHMGPAGTTLLNAFNQSKQAAGDANAMMAAMPPNLRKIAQGMADGTVTQHEWTQGLKSVDPIQANLLKQWLAGEKRATGFSDALKTGGNASQTFAQAMAKATGDSSSLNVSLMLTGENAAKTQQNIKDIAGASTEAGNHVRGWAEVQATFNQKVSEVRASLGAWLIQIGTALLPAITSMVAGLQSAVAWMAANKTWIGLVASVVAGLVGPLIAVRMAIMAWEAVRIVILNIRVAMWLLNASIAANPVVALGLAIAALVAGIIYAYFHFQAFRNVIDAIGNFFKTVFLAVIHAVGVAISWVVDHWKIFAAVIAVLAAPITIMIGLFLLIKAHLHDIGAAATWLYDHAIKPAFDAIRNTVQTVVDWVSSTWRKMSAPVIDEWNKIRAKLAEIWQLLVTLWNATGGKLVSWISAHMTQIRHVFEAVWGAISVQFRAAWTVISAVVGGTLSIVVGIIKTGWDLVKGIFKIAWDVIVTTLAVGWDILKGIFGIAFAVIKGIIVNAWAIIVGIFKVAWAIISGVINTVLDVIIGTIKIFIDLVTGNWSGLWRDIKSLVSNVLGDIWGIIKGVFGGIWDTIKSVGQNLFNTLRDVWNSIKNAVLNIAGDIWSGLKRGIQDAVSVLGTIWDGLKKAFGTPIEFVIRTVLNDGLIKGINVLLKVVGLSIPNIPDPNLPTFATGGVVPGSGPVDSVHAMVTPGEGILVPGAVRGLGGAAAIHGLNALYGGGGGGPSPTSSGLPGFGLGGIVSGILSGLSSAWDALKSVALGGLRAAAVSFFDSVVKPLIAALPGGASLPKEMLTGLANKVEDGILSFLGGKDKAAAAVGGTIPTGARLAILTAALAADGIPQADWPSWEAGLNTLITRESGWNAGIVNTWDSNAKAGHPSGGLGQTIIGTFEAYRNRSLPDNMFDGVANVAAVINYINSRYGGIGHVQQANASMPPKGYDSGGFLPPGLWNGTRKPEPVLTDAQWQKVRPRGGEEGAQHHYHITSIDPVSVAHEIERRETAHLRARL